MACIHGCVKVKAVELLVIPVINFRELTHRLASGTLALPLLLLLLWVWS
jgi:heme A synthase